MKSRSLHLYLLAGLLLFTTSSYSQLFEALDMTPAGGDSTLFSIELPQLATKTKFAATPAYYKHIFIYGDGNFRFEESGNKANFQHLYAPTPTTLLPSYNARALSTGVYSGGSEEPPSQRTGPIIPPGTGTNTPTEVVDANRYLKIMRNVQVKPGDPFVNVLSVHNPDSTSFSGQLFFLYDGQLTTVSTTVASKSPSFSKFHIGESLMYRPDIADQNTYHYSKLGPLGNHFKGMLLREIFNLPPGEEIHFFVKMEGDTSMLSMFESTAKAEMDFAVALGTYSDDNGYPDLTPDSLRQELSSINLSTFINGIGIQGVLPDSTTLFNPATDTSFLNVNVPSPEIGAPIILDYYKSTASLVKSHDPNFMVMEACACQKSQDRYQIFTTVQCENTGFGETTNIYMDIKLPAGVTSDDVVVTPAMYHPANGPTDDISLVKLAPDSIRWQLLNFGIEGTPVHGVGDPRTYANVKFNMYSNVKPELLDSIYACIRFDDLSNDPVCTVPVAVSLIGPGGDEGSVLACVPGSCSDDPGTSTGIDLPWWLWLLILLFIIILLLIIRARNSQS